MEFQQKLVETANAEGGQELWAAMGLGVGALRCAGLGLQDEMAHKLVGLRRLSVRGQGLRTIPGEVFELPALEVVDVGDNALPCIPVAILKARNLNTLKWERNGVREVGEFVGELTGLHRLSLDGNLFRELPASLSWLFRLKTLSLSDCGLLEALPLSLGQLVHLEDLRLENCGMLTVPNKAVISLGAGPVTRVLRQLQRDADSKTPRGIPQLDRMYNFVHAERADSLAARDASRARLGKDGMVLADWKEPGEASGAEERLRRSQRILGYKIARDTFQGILSEVEELRSRHDSLMRRSGNSGAYFCNLRLEAPPCPSDSCKFYPFGFVEFEMRFPVSRRDQPISGMSLAVQSHALRSLFASVLDLHVGRVQQPATNTILLEGIDISQGVPDNIMCLFTLRIEADRHLNVHRLSELVTVNVYSKAFAKILSTYVAKLPPNVVLRPKDVSLRVTRQQLPPQGGLRMQAPGEATTVHLYISCTGIHMAAEHAYLTKAVLPVVAKILMRRRVKLVVVDPYGVGINGSEYSEIIEGEGKMKMMGENTVLAPLQAIHESRVGPGRKLFLCLIGDSGYGWIPAKHGAKGRAALEKASQELGIPWLKPEHSPDEEGTPRDIGPPTLDLDGDPIPPAEQLSLLHCEIQRAFLDDPSGCEAVFAFRGNDYRSSPEWMALPEEVRAPFDHGEEDDEANKRLVTLKNKIRNHSRPGYLFDGYPVGVHELAARAAMEVSEGGSSVSARETAQTLCRLEHLGMFVCETLLDTLSDYFPRDMDVTGYKHVALDVLSLPQMMRKESVSVTGGIRRSSVSGFLNPKARDPKSLAISSFDSIFHTRHEGERVQFSTHMDKIQRPADILVAEAARQNGIIKCFVEEDDNILIRNSLALDKFLRGAIEPLSVDEKKGKIPSRSERMRRGGPLMLLTGGSGCGKTSCLTRAYYRLSTVDEYGSPKVASAPLDTAAGSSMAQGPPFMLKSFAENISERGLGMGGIHTQSAMEPLHYLLAGLHELTRDQLLLDESLKRSQDRLLNFRDNMEDKARAWGAGALSGNERVRSSRTEQTKGGAEAVRATIRPASGRVRFDMDFSSSASSKSSDAGDTAASKRPHSASAFTRPWSGSRSAPGRPLSGSFKSRMLLHNKTLVRPLSALTEISEHLDRPESAKTGMSDMEGAQEDVASARMAEVFDELLGMHRLSYSADPDRHVSPYMLKEAIESCLCAIRPACIIANASGKRVISDGRQERYAEMPHLGICIDGISSEDILILSKALVHLTPDEQARIRVVVSVSDETLEDIDIQLAAQQNKSVQIWPSSVRRYRMETISDDYIQVQGEISTLRSQYPPLEDMTPAERGLMREAFLDVTMSKFGPALADIEGLAIVWAKRHLSRSKDVTSASLDVPDWVKGCGQLLMDTCIACKGECGLRFLEILVLTKLRYPAFPLSHPQKALKPLEDDSTYTQAELEGASPFWTVRTLCFWILDEMRGKFDVMPEGNQLTSELYPKGKVATSLLAMLASENYGIEEEDLEQVLSHVRPEADQYTDYPLAAPRLEVTTLFHELRQFALPADSANGILAVVVDPSFKGAIEQWVRADPASRANHALRCSGRMEEVRSCLKDHHRLLSDPNLDHTWTGAIGRNIAAFSDFLWAEGKEHKELCFDQRTGNVDEAKLLKMKALWLKDMYESFCSLDFFEQSVRNLSASRTAEIYRRLELAMKEAQGFDLNQHGLHAGRELLAVQTFISLTGKVSDIMLCGGMPVLLCVAKFNEQRVKSLVQGKVAAFERKLKFALWQGRDIENKLRVYSGLPRIKHDVNEADTLAEVRGSEYVHVGNVQMDSELRSLALRSLSQLRTLCLAPEVLLIESRETLFKGYNGYGVNAMQRLGQLADGIEKALAGALAHEKRLLVEDSEQERTDIRRIPNTFMGICTLRHLFSEMNHEVNEPEGLLLVTRPSWTWLTSRPFGTVMPRQSELDPLSSSVDRRLVCVRMRKEEIPRDPELFPANPYYTRIAVDSNLDSQKLVMANGGDRASSTADLHRHSKPPLIDIFAGVAPEFFASVDCIVELALPPIDSEELEGLIGRVQARANAEASALEIGRSPNEISAAPIPAGSLAFLLGHCVPCLMFGRGQVFFYDLASQVPLHLPVGRVGASHNHDGAWFFSELESFRRLPSPFGRSIGGALNPPPEGVDLPGPTGRAIAYVRSNYGIPLILLRGRKFLVWDLLSGSPIPEFEEPRDLHEIDSPFHVVAGLDDWVPSYHVAREGGHDLVAKDAIEDDLAHLSAQSGFLASNLPHGWWPGSEGHFLLFAEEKWAAVDPVTGTVVVRGSLYQDTFGGNDEELRLALWHKLSSEKGTKAADSETEQSLQISYAKVRGAQASPTQEEFFAPVGNYMCVQEPHVFAPPQGSRFPVEAVLEPPFPWFPEPEKEDPDYNPFAPKPKPKKEKKGKGKKK